MDFPPVRKVAGTELPFYNSPADVDTIFADGIAALIADESTFKVSFYEKIPHNNEMMGRFVVNLTLSRVGIKELQNHLNRIVQDIEAQEAASK